MTVFLCLLSHTQMIFKCINLLFYFSFQMFACHSPSLWKYINLLSYMTFKFILPSCSGFPRRCEKERRTPERRGRRAMGRHIITRGWRERKVGSTGWKGECKWINKGVQANGWRLLAAGYPDCPITGSIITVMNCSFFTDEKVNLKTKSHGSFFFWCICLRFETKYTV